MGKKFTFADIMNAKSKATAAVLTDQYKDIWLSPYEIKSAPENTHQELKNIEELADSFLHVGQEQPTVLAKVNGEYKIIDGHRRNAANIFNLERGYKEYAKIKYRYREMSEAMYELALLAGNGFTQALTPYEKTRLAERMKAALIRAKNEEGLEIKGKMRDLVAAMMGESSTNVARMESINNNATEEIKEQLKNGALGVTAAYEAAKLPEEEQKEIAAEAAEGKEVRAKEIAKRVEEKKAEEKETDKEYMNPPEEARLGDDYETPHPESITSLCYSCLHYSDCNVKTGTCKKCDQYTNKAETEKTEEQRYNEEQDRIDRDTKKKLQQMSDQKKMENAPGNTETTAHQVRVSKDRLQDIKEAGFDLRRNDNCYKQGDTVELMEFAEGRYTGKSVKVKITYLLEDHTGLEEGYCIMALKLLDKVSETDTKGEKL